MHFLYNLWDQMWPNVFAPSIFSLFAIIMSHIKRGQENRRLHRDTRAHIDQKHAEMKAHITGAVVSTAWMKPEKPGPRS